MMKDFKEIKLPLTDRDVARLRAGDCVTASGVIYTARDQAHNRMSYLVKTGKKLPFSLKGNVIFYCGPTFKQKKITSCGPTTSSRMDKFTPFLLRRGLRGTIGKGRRSEEVVAACRKYKSIYFVAPAGCAAYLGQCITGYSIVGFRDLGPEAVYKFEIKDFPLIVAIDSHGNYIYKERKTA